MIRNAFNAAIETIHHASGILIVGSRSTASLANHLWFGLNKIALDAARALAVSTDTYDRLNRMDAAACLIVIGFPRYLQELVDLLGHARERKIKTVTITDSPFSPLAWPRQPLPAGGAPRPSSPSIARR